MEERNYRRWVEDKDLVSFEAKVEESDLFIRAKEDLKEQALESIIRYRGIIQEYANMYPGFAKSLEPIDIMPRAPHIIQEMIAAASYAGVGPMASVAGAVAEYVGRDLLEFSSRLIVENGGDIFINTETTRKIGIFAGTSKATGRLALEIPAGRWGVCTSSGTVGHSLSFGKADAAIVICRSAIMADAWATRLGNMVKTDSDIEKTLEFVKEVEVVLGVVLIIGDKIGARGEIKLVES